MPNLCFEAIIEFVLVKLLILCACFSICFHFVIMRLEYLSHSLLPAHTIQSLWPVMLTTWIVQSLSPIIIVTIVFRNFLLTLSVLFAVFLWCVCVCLCVHRQVRLTERNLRKQSELNLTNQQVLTIRQQLMVRKQSKLHIWKQSSPELSGPRGESKGKVNQLIRHPVWGFIHPYYWPSGVCLSVYVSGCIGCSAVVRFLFF